MNDSKKSEELLRGVVIFILLAALTGAEYWLAVSAQLWGALIALALLKASLVIQNYMHVSRLVAEEGGHA